MLKHIVIKMMKIKDKDKTLKATREKQPVTYRGTPIRLSTDFSTETQQARREQHDIFKVMKGKNLQLRIFYPVVQIWWRNQRLSRQAREFSAMKPALQQILRELLQAGNMRKGKDLQKINAKHLRKW